MLSNFSPICVTIWCEMHFTESGLQYSRVMQLKMTSLLSLSERHFICYFLPCTIHGCLPSKSCCTLNTEHIFTFCDGQSGLVRPGGKSECLLIRPPWCVTLFLCGLDTCGEHCQAPMMSAPSSFWRCHLSLLSSLVFCIFKQLWRRTTTLLRGNFSLIR